MLIRTEVVKDVQFTIENHDDCIDIKCGDWYVFKINKDGTFVRQGCIPASTGLCLNIDGTIKETLT